MKKMTNKRLLGLTQTQWLILIGMSGLSLCVIVLFGGYIIYQLTHPIGIAVLPISIPQLQQPTIAPPTSLAPTNKPVSTYGQILEANGYTYNANDNTYTSNCGLIVSVKQDHVGFATYINGDDCSTKELGYILTTMYPLDVVDFVIANLTSAMESYQPIVGQAAGHKVSIYYDHVSYILAVVVLNGP